MGVEEGVAVIASGGGWSPDVAGNRRQKRYSLREQVRRVLWSVGRVLFRYSLPRSFQWRRLILRLHGAAIGAHAQIYNSVVVQYPWLLQMGDYCAIGPDALIYNLGRVTIGDRVTISYRAHLCAGSHDLLDRRLPLTRPRIEIGSGTWIGTDAFIGPGVVIGEAAVIGARAVVVRNVAAGHFVAGNPARTIRVRAEYGDQPVSRP